MSESTDGGVPTVVVVTVVVTVNLEDAGVSVALAPNADPPANPDAGTVDPTPDTGAVLPEASTTVADSGSNSSETSTIIFADTIPDAGTEASVPEASTPALTPIGLGNSCNLNGTPSTFYGPQSSGLCQAGIFCVPYSPPPGNNEVGVCQVSPNIALSGACLGPGQLVGGAFGYSCQAGLTCRNCGPGCAECLAPSELGGVCNNVIMDQGFAFCDTGLTCLGHPCNNLNSGVSCANTTYYNTSSGLETSGLGSSTCVLPRTSGESCQVNGDCAQDSFPAQQCIIGDGGLTCQSQ
jgi:hypothetical protein